MESITYFKNIKTSPKKLRMVMAEIKKLKPVAALDYLMYSPHKAGKTFYKVIQSAINNGKNTLKVNDDMLKFKVFTVEEGQKLRRYLPGSRGTMKPILKRYSHIKIILETDETKQEPVIAEKVEKKAKEINVETANAEIEVQADKKPAQPKKKTVEKKVKSPKTK